MAEELKQNNQETLLRKREEKKYNRISTEISKIAIFIENMNAIDYSKKLKKFNVFFDQKEAKRIIKKLNVTENDITEDVLSRLFKNINKNFILLL